MNKKNLSFISLLTLSVALLGGCGDGDRNVNDTVLQVGNKKYTAEQLYNELLASGTGANEAFAMVLRLVIESSMETNKNLQAAADMAEEKFEEEVKTHAKSNGISVKDARKALLEEKGYESVDEMKADIIYEQKKTRVEEQFWEKNKTSEEFYDSYIENRLPYLVKHILLKIDENTNGNKIANNVNVSQTEAEKLYDIINRLKNGDTFSYVANHFSEDSGSIATGGAYYMDTTTSFVDEFLYGTYIFDDVIMRILTAEKETVEFVGVFQIQVGQFHCGGIGEIGNIAQLPHQRIGILQVAQGLASGYNSNMVFHFGDPPLIQRYYSTNRMFCI